MALAPTAASTAPPAVDSSFRNGGIGRFLAPSPPSCANGAVLSSDTVSTQNRLPKTRSNSKKLQLRNLTDDPPVQRDADGRCACAAHTHGYSWVGIMPRRKRTGSCGRVGVGSAPRSFEPCPHATRSTYSLQKNRTTQLYLHWSLLLYSPVQMGSWTWFLLEYQKPDGRSSIVKGYSVRRTSRAP